MSSGGYRYVGLVMKCTACSTEWVNVVKQINLHMTWLNFNLGHVNEDVLGLPKVNHCFCSAPAKKLGEIDLGHVLILLE
jgi:hypothetical protein